MRRLLAIALLLFAAPLAATRTTPGYTSRACGFDMDNDGTFGEATDDCNVCDGSTVDPDGDSDPEDLNYVDSATGVDESDCGASNDPCATVAYVLNGTNSSYSKYADGVGGDDPEDIICVKGTITMSTKDDVLNIDGETASHTAQYYDTDVAQWGSGGNADFQYPSDPFMIVGWDADNDGSYPPHDQDDTAILSCDQGGGTYTERMFNLTASYVEIAHLRIEKCGYDEDTENGGNGPGAGFVIWNSATDSHHWFHDLEFYQVLYDASHYSASIFFSAFDWDNKQWLAFENLNIIDGGAYVFRGGPETMSDVKIEYITAQFHCNTGSPTNWYNGCTFYRTWNELDRVSISYNYLDYDGDTWFSSGGDSAGLAVAPSTCNRTFWIRGNTFKGFHQATYVRPNTTEYCLPARPMENILFENNLYDADWTYATWGHGFQFKIEDGGDTDASLYLKSLKFYNNIIVESTGESMNQALWFEGGGNDTTDVVGTYEIVGNTIYGPFAGGQANVEFEDTFTYNADVDYKNNVISGRAGSPNISWYWTDASFTGGENTYDDDSTYYWDGVLRTLAQWNTDSGDSGTECDPTFVNAPNGDVHLQSGDSCAKDQGADVSGYTSIDYDEDSRPQGGSWDIGADEFFEGFVGVSTQGTTMVGIN